MKTKLVLLLFLFISLNSVSQRFRNINISPNSNLLGAIYNSKGQYSRQESGLMSIGTNNIGTDNQSTGRGYLEFNLNSLPRNITIQEVSLKYTLINRAYKNYGGNIVVQKLDRQIYNTSDYQYLAGNTTSPKVEASYTASFGKTLIKLVDGMLKNPTKENIVMFTVKNKNETSQCLDLSDFSLDIKYSVNEQVLYANKESVKIGEIIEYQPSLSITTPSSSWKYPAELFDVLVKSNTQLSLKPKVNLKGLYETVVEYKDANSNIYKKSSIVVGDLTPQMSSQNTNIAFNISGVSSLPGSKISWTFDNLTSISGLQTANPIFKTSITGYASVKAVITYKGLNYESPTYKFWTGKSEVRIVAPISGSFEANKLYRFNLSSTGGPISKLKWTGSGLISIGNTNGQEVAIMTGYAKNGGSFKITVTGTDYLGNTVTAIFGGNVTAYNSSNSSGTGFPIQERMLTTSTPEYKEIEIFNLSGIRVKKITNSSNFNIKDERLNSGIYIIKYLDNEGNTRTEKVNIPQYKLYQKVSLKR